MIAEVDQRQLAHLDVPSSIETERLVLRPHKMSDAAAMAELANDRTVAEMMVAIPHPFTMADAEAYLARTVDQADKTKWRFAITRKNTFAQDNSGEFMGVIGVTLRDGEHALGYWLGRRYRRRGYMSEAARALVAAFFETGEVDEIVSGARQINDASLALLGGLGFTHVGTGLLRSAALKGSVPVDNYRLTSQDFAAKMAERADHSARPRG